MLFIFLAYVQPLAVLADLQKSQVLKALKRRYKMEIHGHNPSCSICYIPHCFLAAPFVLGAAITVVGLAWETASNSVSCSDTIATLRDSPERFSI